MNMRNENLVYSASMLQDFVDCQRRFELKYVLKQSWPSIPVEPVLEIEALMARGRQFHFLAHQFFARVPISTINAAIDDDVLAHWFDHFFDFTQHQDWVRTLSEIQFGTLINQHQVIAVYDLVASAGNGQIFIFDWKTSILPPKKKYLVEKMQTLIYPFILFENLPRLFPGFLQEEQRSLSMVYWFPEFPDSSIIFEYDQDQHQKNSQILVNILNQINIKLASQQFSCTSDKRKCRFCQYRSLCDRGIIAGRVDESDTEESSELIEIDFDALPEMNADI